MKEHNFKVVCLYPELDAFCFLNLEKYNTYNVSEDHYGGIDNKGQYYINNFWYSKKCFVSLCDVRKQKIEHLKTKIYGVDKGQHIKK